ncbi:AzlD domain-containing protein [Agrobacterium sp. lyk4-40-TYG-31]|uniref:AzlD domain-containing protein n=1 Tax=Agrobacterium sp. lyk4-40-TYG-31 TaxID=3040276 RepID=UPI000DCFF132|nr:AzlD domain-containing protein [Agrobacterium sp. lyk4-40-TYG-31]
MSVWTLILFSGGTALLFRVLPIAFGHIASLQDTRSVLYRFLNYSSQAMLGAMCFTMAFGRNDITMLVHAAPSETLLICTLLVIAGLVVVRTGYVLATVLFATGAYALLLLP